MRFIMTLKPGIHRPAKPVRSDITPNIEAQERAIKNAKTVEEKQILSDTMLILHQVRNGLPKSRSK